MCCDVVPKYPIGMILFMFLTTTSIALIKKKIFLNNTNRNPPSPCECIRLVEMFYLTKNNSQYNFLFLVMQLYKIKFKFYNQFFFVNIFGLIDV